MKMNYQTILKTTLLACTVGIMAACSSDGYDDETPYLAQNYSNKLADGDKANLALTYSGSELIGKNVTFRTSDSKTGTLKLQNILPHETETTLSNVSLISDGKGGYSFNGISTTPLNTTFSFKGKVNGEKMSLDLTDIKTPTNYLTETGKWTMGKPGEYGDNTYGTGHGIAQVKDLTIDFGGFPITLPAGNDFGQMAGTIFGNFIGTVLRDVTFNKDGNITASYAPIPSDMTDNIIQLLGSPIEREDDEWKQSPTNLATAFMTNDSTLYVTPNVDMIIHRIQADKNTTTTATRAASNDYIEHGTFPQNLTDTYATLNQWTTTGLKLIVRKDKENGSIEVVLKADEIKALLKLAKTLPSTIRDKEIEAGPLGKMTIGSLLDIFEFSKDFYVSIYFSPASETSNKNAN